MNDLVNCYKSMTPEMALLMEGCVKSKINMIISGAAGSGKTTLLNILSACIPGSERIVTIENEPETAIAAGERDPLGNATAGYRRQR